MAEFIFIKQAILLNQSGCCVTNCNRSLVVGDRFDFRVTPRSAVRIIRTVYPAPTELPRSSSAGVKHRTS